MSDTGNTANADERMEQAAMALYIHAARLIKEGKSRKEIKKQLKAQGVSGDVAETILRRLAESQANVARQAGYRNMFLGGLITVLAIMLLSGTLTDPATGAGVIVVVLLLAAGILALGRGLMQVQGW